MTDVVCEGCGDKFSIYPSRYKKSKTKTFYCSRECKKSQVPVTCSACGTNFSVQKHITKNNENHYCSQDCWNTRSSSKVSCDNCDESFRRIQAEIDKYDNHYCSRSCYHEDMVTDGDWYNTTEYENWRESVYEKDCYTCQDCGERGGKLNAHHIKRQSEHPELRAEIDNGVTLCVRCHYIRHKQSDEEHAATLIKSNINNE